MTSSPCCEKFQVAFGLARQHEEQSEGGTPSRVDEKVVFDGRFEGTAAKPAIQNCPVIRDCNIRVRRELRRSAHDESLSPQE